MNFRHTMFQHQSISSMNFSPSVSQVPVAPHNSRTNFLNMEIFKVGWDVLNHLFSMLLTLWFGYMPSPGFITCSTYCICKYIYIHRNSRQKFIRHRYHFILCFHPQEIGHTWLIPCPKSLGISLEWCLIYQNSIDLNFKYFFFKILYTFCLGPWHNHFLVRSMG